MEAAIARILDANANRAREGLRVMEDFARFALDDGPVSAALKSLRHDLARVLNGESFKNIVRARDVVDDVGRTAGTESEYTRVDAREVFCASTRRAAEALRALEEYAKTIDAAAARQLERLRYRVYGQEQAVMIRVDARRRFAGRRLYVIITEALCRGDWLATAKAAIEGGADCLQLREKTLPDRELLSRARSLAEVCRNAGVLMIVNDRPDVARLSGADGVHLGQDDLSVADARRIIGPGGLVGLSTHTIEQVRLAADRSPDYIAVGPMFATATKPQEHVPGPALVTAASAATSLPVVAIGGIDEHTIGAVMEAGAHCVCVCSAVISRIDAAAAARELKGR